MAYVRLRRGKGELFSSLPLLRYAKVAGINVIDMIAKAGDECAEKSKWRVRNTGLTESHMSR
jgi:hypothetical protein